MHDKKTQLSLDVIESKIYCIRGQRVMLDRDLAELYGVETKVLKRTVKRNSGRFPPDFMFQLTKDEAYASRCQFGTLKKGQNIKYLPYAFTEQGVAMLSGVLNSKKAVLVNIKIMRAFINLKRMNLSFEDLRWKIEEIEKRCTTLEEKVEALLSLLASPEVEPKWISGFGPVGFLRDR
ncbi:MAG: ORF6N domain-containing protein [Candidatus Margulisiibacteriota bacterium]